MAGSTSSYALTTQHLVTQIMVIKMVVNHLQLIGMAALFPLEWPHFLKKYFSASEVASVSGSAVISLDCEVGELYGI